MKAHPRVGDLLEWRSRFDGEVYVGILNEEIYRVGDSYPSYRVEWFNGKKPWGYIKTYGFSCVNMMNCRKEYRLYRKGERI